VSIFSGEEKRSPESLVAATQDPDWRRETIVAMSRSRAGLDDRWLEAYATILQGDPDPSVRSAAARALARGRNAKYLPALAAALSDASADVRWDAAVALDRVRGEAAVEPLRKAALHDASSDVRGSCARALRHYANPDVAGTLVECLSDESLGVRYQARRSLAAICGRDFGYDAEDWQPLLKGEVDLQPARGRRPWWDWLGVTSRKP
jgi:HEAT repeat protein